MKIAANEKALTNAQTRFDEHRVALDSLKQKADVFAQQPSHDASDSEFDDIGWMARELVVNDDEIDVAFLREQQARSGS